MINKQVTEWHEPPFPRTVCACHDCVQCCKKQPGPLAPGDFERIARWTGELRCPRKGEWYLSGAIVEAYRAPHTFTHQPFRIAVLIKGAQ